MGLSRALNGRAPYPTYSAFGPRSERPSDYEIATVRLHYYVDRGFAVNVPLCAWYARYQQGSPFRCDDWEAFQEPERTTYADYTARAKARELELDRLVEQAAARGDPRQLAAAWRAHLAETLGPLRYPLQGMHMLACYVGQMAPGGRITVAALFQASDELRRIDWLACRTRQLQELAPEFARDARERWERHAAWQPLRELIERLLVSYDWGEAFVALNLCVKPLFDRLLTHEFAARCAHADDRTLAAILQSFTCDATFQQRWSHALALLACTRSDTRAAVRAWIDTWQPRATRAIGALAESFGARAEALQSSLAAHEEWLGPLWGEQT